MKLDNVMMCVFVLILGLLTIHMFSNVCGCKSIVEGQGLGEAPEATTLVPSSFSNIYIDNVGMDIGVLNMDSSLEAVKSKYSYGNLQNDVQYELKRYLTETCNDRGEGYNSGQHQKIAVLFNIGGGGVTDLNSYIFSDSTDESNVFNKWENILKDFYVIWGGDRAGTHFCPGQQCESSYDWKWWLLSDPIDESITLQSLSYCGIIPIDPGVGDSIATTSSEPICEYFRIRI